ncbi:phosphopantetheine-protein transferase [Hyunsoonleella pacifica]|nr:phosphopantetheine-protein transferase [Hyunsoonleella pacifica]
MIKKESIIKHIKYFNKLLSEDEKLKVSKFKFKKDKTTSIIARGSLRVLLSKYLNYPATDFSFSYGVYGKPLLLDNQSIKFNISHSGEIIVIAFCNLYDIGVDIEYVEKGFNVLDIVNNYFSNAEIQALHNLPESEHIEAFYRGWTRKEAFIKAKAKGLSFPLASFSVSIDSDKTTDLYETIWDKKEKELWDIIPFKTATHYKAALAVQAKINSIKYFELNSENILM